MRWIFVVLIGSEVYSIVAYLLSENSDDGNSDCCASAVVTKTPAPQFHFTEHRSVKNTNIAHCKVWGHRNTASWDFIHRITALKKHQHRNTANPHVPLLIIPYTRARVFSGIKFWIIEFQTPVNPSRVKMSGADIACSFDKVDALYYNIYIYGGTHITAPWKN